MSEALPPQRRTKSEPVRGTSQCLPNHAVPESPLEAFRLVCYEFGIAELAAATGYKRGTLYNKADADADSHHQPTLLDVMTVTRVSGDTRILESLDRLFDRAGFDLPPPSACSDEHLLELLCNVGTEHGQLHAALNAALKKKRFKVEDLQRIRSEAFDLVGEVMAFLARLEGLVDE